VLWRCWLGGRKGIRPVKNWVVGCWHGCYLSGSEVQTCTWPSWCHCHSLSLASVKSRLVLPFWYRLTQVALDKGPLNVSSQPTMPNTAKYGSSVQSIAWFDIPRLWLGRFRGDEERLEKWIEILASLPTAIPRISQGTVATFFVCDGQVPNYYMKIFPDSI